MAKVEQRARWTVRELLTWTSERFGSIGIVDPRVDAEYLLARALGCARIGGGGISGLDTVLSVHIDTGAAGTAANELALNDDWQGSGGDAGAACPSIRDSSLALPAVAGDPLLIRVSRFSASTNGAFSLNLSFDIDRKQCRRPGLPQRRRRLVPFRRPRLRHASG